MTAQLTGVSLFAGVGGFDIALERAGVRVVATCEIDDKARGVLAHRFPNTAHFTDIKELRGEQLINEGFDPDNGVIVGGFPCQDLSVAGRRAGLAGARSGLFWEICRLLDETKARYFILENVPGLLSSNGGRDLGTVVGALVERGYGVAYRILDAQHFGVPQRRRRVFIVGSLGGHWRTPSEILALVQGRQRHLAEGFAKRSNVASALTARLGTAGPDDNTAQAGHLVARMRGFGDYELDSNTGALKARDYKDATDLVIPTIMRQREGKPGGGKGPMLSDKSFTIATNNDQTLFASTVRRLTPVECERLQGFPDDWTAEFFDFKKGVVRQAPDSSRYKQMGNAVAVPVVEWIAKRLVTSHEREKER